MVVFALACVAVACTTDPGPPQPGPVHYVYDAASRLRAVVSEGGETATYSYDAAGNIVGIDRFPTTQLSVIELAPARGAVGDEVVVHGTGFGASAGDNQVDINGTPATVTEVADGALTVTVPEGATTGPLTVTVGDASAGSEGDFTVEPDRAPTITGLSATVVAVGDQVVVDGTNFFGDPGLDTVTINGGAAPVSSSTPDELVVEVPPSATSGPLTVTTPEGTADAPGDLFVAPAPFAAADVGFTGRAEVGEPAPVSITTAEKVGLLVFDGTADQRVSVSVGDDQFSSCAPEIRLFAPGGAQLGRLGCSLSTLNLIEPVTLPADGTYTLLVDPGTATGSANLTVHEVTDVREPITPGGGPVPVELGTPGQNAVLEFDATEGQRVSVELTDDTFSSCSPEVRVFGSAGEELGSATCVLNTLNFLDTLAVPADGTYRIEVDPTGNTTGSIGVILHDVPPDVTGTLAPGGDAVTVGITTPGQNGDLSFTGTAGTRVSVQLSGDGLASCSPEVRVLGPDGAELAEDTCVIDSNGELVEPVTLPGDGTYRVVVDPTGTTTGAITVQAHEVTDVTGTITPGGGPVPVTLDTPGQNAALTFTGTTGQRVSVQATDNTFAVCSPQLRLLGPDGAELAEDTCLNTDNELLDTLALPADGTYTVVVDPTTVTTGGVTVEVHGVTDVTGTITPGGGPVPVTLDTPGQNAALTFTGTTGQRVSVQATDDTFASCEPRARLLGPDGAVLAEDTCLNTDNELLDTLALPADGTYTVVVDPRGAVTGSITVRAHDVPPDVSGTLVPGGAPVTVTVGTPGQNGALTFAGSAGQALTLALSGDTFPVCSPRVQVLRPDGTQLASRSCLQGSYDLALGALPASGTYTVLVDPTAATIGAITLALAPTAGPAPAGEEGAGDEAAEGGDAGAGAGAGASEEEGGNAADTGGDTDDGGTDGDDRDAGNGVGDADAGDGDEQARPVDLDLQPAASYAPADGGDGGTDAAHRPPDGGSGGAPTPDAVRARGPDAAVGGPPAVEVHEPALYDPGDGVTAVSGRVVGLDGRPLAGVTLSVLGQAARSDRTGRFLLQLDGVETGAYVLGIDGRSADTADASYGTFEAGVELQRGFTTFLDYTIWMPELDTANTVGLDYPLATDVVVTTPRIPGLELHIPAGSVVRDESGRPVTEIGITPIPVDRTPFPLPEGSDVPVYFTVQPGGAVIGPEGARLVYPNYNDEAPGAWLSFLQYCPEEGGATGGWDGRERCPEAGWTVYGKGTVTGDGTQVVPDGGVTVYEFAGAMINAGGWLPPGFGPNAGDGSEDGDPVDLGTGLFVYEKTDLAVADLLPISLTRTYRQGDDAVRSFGIGTTWAYDLYLWSAQQYQEADLILPDGARIHYDRISAGTGFTDAVFEDTGSPTAFNRSRIAWNGNGWDLTLKDGTTFVFGDEAPLQSIRDGHGNEITLHRQSRNVYGSETGNIVSIQSPSGRYLGFGYDDQNRVIEARDHTGRAVAYAYDEDGRLSTVTGPEGGVTTYAYDDSHRMVSITDPRGITFLTNGYDAAGRVATQTQADGTTYGFAYTTDAEGVITQTDVTDPRGTVRRVTFDGGYRVTDTRALGTPEEETVTLERAAGSRLVTAVVDGLGRRTTYGYDTADNLTSVTSPAGTDDAVATSFTYEPDNGRLATVTDALGNTTTYAYDDDGNVDTITDPEGAVTALAHDDSGRLTSVTDPLGGTTSFAYTALSRVRTTGPDGHVSDRYLDASGRPTITVDPLGNRSTFAYDDLNRLLTATGPLGDETGFGYDPNGNLTSVTDARGNATTFVYDPMDRLSTRTDPLGATDTYAYDPSGNLTGHTDRRGVTTTVAYDRRHRPTTTTFGVTPGGAESTITTTYDEAGRPVQVDDSAYGTVTLTYDSFDRLTGETTPDGTVTHAYDDAGRRTSTTVDGTETTYGYDDVGRLTGITRGGIQVSATRDAAGRVTGATLPNGVTADYDHDTAGRLTSIGYTAAGGDLGDLTYGYDPLGRVVDVGGSLATTNLPAAVASADYDAANRLVTWGGRAFTHDAAGNLTGDGTATYAWDARGQLASIGGPAPEAFGYDPFGRRVSRTAGGNSTGYRYDGANVAVEQGSAAGSPPVTYLTGLVMDEVLARTVDGVTTTYLTDRLNSVVGLVDGTGTLATSYSYDPFGATQSDGAEDPNPYGFTGREDDGNGLYYYRARYYRPETGRFVSEDPLGFAAGDPNLYAYVGNNPTNAVDPTGLCGVDAIVDVGFLAYDVYALFRDGRKNLGTNLLAGAADIGGLLIPCASGGGAAVRGARAADDILDAGRRADNVGDVAQAAGRACSFSADTPVLMADGATTPISEVEVGDDVLATDPETGETGARDVAATLPHADLLLTLRTSAGEIVTTEDHRYWNASDGEWQESQDLDPGDRLLTPDGDRVVVEGLDWATVRAATAYDLDVAGIDTFYVGAGDEAVLVHNSGLDCLGLGLKTDRNTGSLILDGPMPSHGAARRLNPMDRAELIEILETSIANRRADQVSGVFPQVDPGHTARIAQEERLLDFLRSLR